MDLYVIVRKETQSLYAYSIEFMFSVKMHHALVVVEFDNIKLYRCRKLSCIYMESTSYIHAWKNNDLKFMEM